MPKLKQYGGQVGFLLVLVAISSYLCGDLVIPCIPSVLGGLSASTMRKSNLCSNVVMNKNISILASESPRHLRLPEMMQYKQITHLHLDRQRYAPLSEIWGSKRGRWGPKVRSMGTQREVNVDLKRGRLGPKGRSMGTQV